VNHSAREYVRKLDSGVVAHTNTAEPFFALIKRGHYGVYHQMSKKHLHRYCAEFGFRWDYQRFQMGLPKVNDGERTDKAVKQAEGVRSTYEQPVEQDGITS
jgi:hypothetical protein